MKWLISVLVLLLMGMVGLVAFQIGREAGWNDPLYERAYLGDWQKETGFFVDGNHYYMKGVYKESYVSPHLKWSSFVMLIVPFDRKETVVPHMLVDRDESHMVGYIDFKNKPATPYGTHKEYVWIGSVCLIDRDKILVSRTDEELGIKRFRFPQDFSKEKLLPILEKLIRENVKPPAHETEE